MSYNGYKKKSLSISGSISAILVGFISFTCSYRFGFILILFYYSSSKLTRYKGDIKSTIEENHKISGERDIFQVVASSLLATIVASLFLYLCGEDQNISFSAPSSMEVIFLGIISIPKETLSAYLWILYVSHYATATADTWASELGVLAKMKPRLVTSLFLKKVLLFNNKLPQYILYFRHVQTI